MDHLDPQKYIEEQRARQQAAEAESVEQGEDSGSAAGLIGILVALLSVLAFVASYLLDSREEPQPPPASERSEMATEFWGPDSEPIEVDTPGGMYSEVFKFRIDVDQGVNCHFVIAETRPHENWSPTAAIALSELGRSEPDAVGEEYVKITAVLPSAEDDVGRVYNLSTWENEQQYSYPFLRTMKSEDEIWLLLGSRSDGDFAYRASERSGEYGAGLYYRPSIEPRVATVILSGTKGMIDCEIVDI